MGRIRTRSQGFLLPDRLKVKLRIEMNFTMTLDSNGNQATQFLGNSPFDPDGSGTSNGQPTGWDIYTQFYRFYYCPGSKIKCRVINTNNDLQTAADPITSQQNIGIVPGTNQLSNTDLVTMHPKEWPYSKEFFLPPYPASPTMKTFTSYMATKKIYGYKTADHPNFISAVTASPSNLWYWNIYSTSPNGISAVGKQTQWRVEITYYCHFFGRVEIPVS